MLRLGSLPRLVRRGRRVRELAVGFRPRFGRRVNLRLQSFDRRLALGVARQLGIFSFGGELLLESVSGGLRLSKLRFDSVEAFLRQNLLRVARLVQAAQLADLLLECIHLRSVGLRFCTGLGLGRI